MIQVQIRSPSEKDNATVVELVENILKAVGYECHVSSQVLARDKTAPSFDFLLGRTESQAYELIQETGFIARIVSRNGISMVVTRDLRTDRVNLRIVNNVVTEWFLA